MTKFLQWRDESQGKMGPMAQPKPVGAFATAEPAVSTRVSHRLANAREDIRYQKSITEIYLLFDGESLSIRNTKDNVILRRFPAVSGRPQNGKFDYSRERQRIPSVGPIPAGEYHISMNEIQKITLWDDAVGTLTKVINHNKGSWPGGRMAWGSQRAWIKPEEVIVVE